MTLYQNSAADLVLRTLDDVLGDLKSGTATGGSATTVVDTTRYESDDHFQSTTPVSRVYIYATTDGASPQGKAREATDWVQTGGTLTFAPTMTELVGTGDKYAITSVYRWGEVLGAINMAIDMIARQVLIEKLDEALTLESDTYEYNIPEGFIYLYRISMATDDGDYPNAVPPDHWKIIRGTPFPRIHFSRFPVEGQYQDHYYSELWADVDLSADKVIRIEGYQRQPRLETDDDLCYINPDFLCYQAAALLHAKRITRSENDPDEHRTQYEVCQGIADRISGGAPYYRRMRTQLPIDCKRVIA